MHEVYIYGSGQNFDGLGLCGALSAISCIHDETAGGNSEVTLEHPIDELGKWQTIRPGHILKCWVPVRETPLLKLDRTETVQETIVRDVYRVKTKGRRLHLRQQPNTSARILSKYNPGSEVVKLADAGSANGYTWYQVAVSSDGATGYMAATYLEYVRTYTETIMGTDDATLESTDEAAQINWAVRPQLFEIYDIAPSENGIVANARHISYRLLKNSTTYMPSGEVTLQSALNGILDNCEVDHDFEAYTDISEKRSGISWKQINPIKAMLDSEAGALAKWNCQLIRDNWAMFFLKRAGGNRGMRIEAGKNLVGVSYSENISNTATRIKPIGKNQDGTDLYLPEKYVDSPYIDAYEYPMLYPLECSDCKVGTDGVTVEIAYTRMREQAQRMFDGGCDRPTRSIKVDFLLLGDSEETAQYQALDKLFLYDQVTIVDTYIEDTAEVMSLSWDCLNDRPVGIEVGSIAASMSSSKVASWQIPSGINGTKLISGSVGAAQLGEHVVSARHVQAKSINTEALQAESVTTEKLAALSVIAEKIAAGAITAEKIAAGAIDAETVKAITAYIGSITAGNIETDQLASVLGEFVKLYADFAGIDFATIKDLTVEEFIFRVGSAGELYIDRLAVTSANIVSAMLGELVVKGDDGKYYRLHVGADGEINAEEVTVTDGEIVAGQTGAGQQIVDTSINVKDLNAQTIKGASAIITEIFTDALNAGKITAGQAMIASASIPELYTTAITALGNNIDITANSTIQLLIGTNELIRAWYTFTEDGMRVGKAGSTYSTLTDDTGFHVLQLGEKIGSFAKRQLAAETVRVGRVDTPDSRIVLREAPDGGLAILPEVIS